MEDIFDTELTAEEKAELIKKCDQYIEATQRILDRIGKDWEEIDRINAETRAILARLQDQMRKAA